MISISPCFDEPPLMVASTTHTPLFKTVLLVEPSAIPSAVPSAVTGSPGYFPLDSILIKFHSIFVFEYWNTKM